LREAETENDFLKQNFFEIIGGSSESGVLFGAALYYSGNAAFGSTNANNAPSNANTNIGSS
jgi:hypothetical protein